MRLPKIPKAWLVPPHGFKKPNVQHFKEDMQRLGEEIAEGYKEQVTRNIEENRFGYSLADSTIQRKGSSTPLIDSRTLINAIFREGTSVSVEDTPREDSPLSNLQLAIVHEYGTKDLHIPARPVWRDTFAEYKDVARKRVLSFLKTQRFK